MSEETQFDPDKEHGPIAWMAKNRVAANVLMLILIVGGLVTLASGIKQEVFPEVEMDMITADDLLKLHHSSGVIRPRLLSGRR